MNYWFKRKRYGWGWVPVTWQGWLSVLLFVLFVLWFAFTMLEPEEAITTGRIIGYFVGITAATFLLIYISVKKGPKGKWRWGAKPDDNPEEDF